MRLILTDKVSQLIAMTIKDWPAGRVFLEPVYLQPDSDEPSWALVSDERREKVGIKLQSDQFTIWCAENNRDYLNNKVLISDKRKGFIAVQAIVLEG